MSATQPEISKSNKIQAALESAETCFKENPNEKSATFGDFIAFNIEGQPIIFDKTQCIGKGSYGSVFVGYDKTGGRFAIKAENNKKLQEYIEMGALDKKKELKIMAKLGRAKSEGIVYGTDYYSIMRLEEGDELFKAIWPKDKKQRKNELSEVDRLVIALKAAYDVNFLHENRIIHGDIKPENMMFSNVESPELGSQIIIANIDFGFSLELPEELPEEEDHILSISKGTPGYMAPEVDTDDLGNFSFASDVYALGAVFTKGLKINLPVCNDMLSEDKSTRPTALAVVSELVDALKMQPFEKLDKKAIELIDICENHRNAKIKEDNLEHEKRSLSPQPLIQTYKEQVIENTIQDFNTNFEELKQKSKKQNSHCFDFLDDNQKDLDQKAIALKGYLLQQLKLEQKKSHQEQSSHFLTKNQKQKKKKSSDEKCDNINKMIAKIDKISRKASFLGKTGCEEYYKSVSTKRNPFQNLFNRLKDSSTSFKAKAQTTNPTKKGNKRNPWRKLH